MNMTRNPFPYGSLAMCWLGLSQVVLDEHLDGSLVGIAVGLDGCSNLRQVGSSVEHVNSRHVLEVLDVDREGTSGVDVEALELFERVTSGRTLVLSHDGLLRW